MNKRYLLTLSLLALLAGCDDGASSPSDPTDPCSACLPNQTCDNGICKDNPDPSDPCAKCDPQYEECINNKCETKRPSDDPCSACTDEEVCIDKVCQPKTEATCDPACDEGKTCVDGRCAICVGTNCFFESDDGNKFCDTDDECDDNQRCYEGECQDIDAAACDPACTDGQICVNGTCQNDTLLWSLCRSGSDCGVGECIFNVTPSKVIHLEINGEIVEYTPDKPIPVSLLDDRINPDNYNRTHSSQAGLGEDIGICSYDCTKEENSECPSGWSCQVVAKGILDYPDSSELPKYLPEESLKDTPFAALCRRDMTEELQKDISYGIEFCNSDEKKCTDAGMIFYDGMCLEPCETSAERCPYFFSCQSVETGSGSAMACVPNAGTCTECYDHDKDGAGYGHCTNKGIDCDDDNPNAYYQKPLTCSDIVDNNGDEIKTDLNCNGIIDKFELLGTTDNCGSCGNACAKPQTSNITVTCDPKSASDYDPNWRVSATMDTEAPEFACVEKCSFGYGDCKGDATCNVALLTPEARAAAKESESVIIATSDVIVNDNQGKIYALDRDGDGFPMIDLVNTQAPEDPAKRHLMLDANNSVICCASNEKYCYSANKDWTSIPLSATTQAIENEDGSQTILKYASPEKSNAANSYDIDDNDKAVNPSAADVCDGKDNDGSTILARETAMPCSVWCKDNADTCSKFSVTSGSKTTYNINAYCDVTEDGVHQDGEHNPGGWADIVENNKLYHFGDTCNRRSNKGDICNTGKVTCEADPVIRCVAGSENCSCGVDASNHAFRITESNTTIGEGGKPTYNPKSSDYVKEVITSGGEVQAINCRCDGSLCTEGGCTDKDSPNCFAACVHSCSLDTSYSLACTVTDEGSESDGIVEGKPVFDGLDDDCDGRVDEDAMIPCIININAAYSDLKKGVDASAYTAFTRADGYKLPQNNDGSINLCRIGILQSKKTNVDNKVTFTPICVPLYQPRDYDFYGDAFDSNCDGVDYDIEHTVFVENSEQGASLGGDDFTCRFTSGLDYVTPCATLQGALAKAKNESGTFYDDILITAGKDYVIDTDTQIKGSDNITVSAIEIPTIAKQDSKTKHFYYSGAGLPDEADHIQDGHIISAYKLHELLVKAKRSKSSFDPNKYLFSYEINTPFSTLDANGKLVTEYAYAPVTHKAEQPQPDEVIRIYGGFNRSIQSSYHLPSEHDLWNRAEDSVTTIQWTPAITQNNNSYYKTYALMHPSSSNALSLKLDSLVLNMNPSGALPKGLVDGATFIGINGMVGAKLLNLINIKLNVTAPNGYSYGQTEYPTSTATAGQDGGNSWFQENRSGVDSGYVNTFNANTCQTHSRTCGSGINSTTAQNWGGCGGHAWTTKNYNTNNSLASDDGRQGYHGRKGAGATNNGGKAGTSNGMGGGEDWYCPKLNDHRSAQGQNGEGGAPGKNGDSSKTTMKFELTTATPNSIYVSSDRSQAKGHYGEPGKGGGGGAVYQCWEGNGSNDSRCYAAGGGMGGCGGEGGQAGGTGGSAIGIAVRSTSNVENSTQILMDDKTMITTKNGNGGKPQAGAQGATGGRGGYWKAYARCGGTAKYCSDTQDEGMGGGGSGGGGGAGGDGGGGVAGWTYPFVFTCKNASVSKFTDEDPLSLANCGYNLPAEFVLVASKRGKQDATGTRMKDITYSAESTESKRGKQREAVSDYTAKFTDLKDISLRWSRDSSYGGQNCGGSNDYRVPGGSGGTALSVSSQDSEVDTSCLRNGKTAIIIKSIKE